MWAVLRIVRKRSQGLADNLLAQSELLSSICKMNKKELSLSCRTDETVM